MSVSCDNCGAALASSVCGYCGTSYRLDNEYTSSDNSEAEKQKQAIFKKIEYLRNSYAPENVKLQKIANLENQLRELG